MPHFDEMRRPPLWTDGSEPPVRAAAPQKLSLACATCGYGICRPAPPARCPMCQAEGSWRHTPWRPFAHDR